MPNIKSVKKDVERSRARHIRNMAAKSNLKTSIKKSQIAIEASNEQAAELVRASVRLIDKTATKGIIHKNAAARRKSRLMKRLAKLSA